MTFRLTRWLHLSTTMLAACSCEDGGRSVSSLDVRVAHFATEPTAACPGPGTRAGLPESWSCTRLSIRDRDRGFLPITIRDGTIGPFNSPVVVPFGANNDFVFDVPDIAGDFFLELTIHDRDGVPVALGGVDLPSLDGPVRVPTYVLGEANCLVLQDGEMPVSRALHRAVLLQDDDRDIRDILVFGGVQGSMVSSFRSDGMDQPGFRPQPVIESYRPRDGSWVRATNTFGGGEAELSLVMFASMADPVALSDGRFRIRTAGGFTAFGSAVVGIDEGKSLNRAGAPVVPLPSAIPASDFEVLYDPETRSVQINELTAGAALGSAISGRPVSGRGLMVSELRSASVSTRFQDVPVSSPALYSASAFSLLEGQTPRTEVAAGALESRFGAGVARLPDDSGWLVFGGLRLDDQSMLAGRAAATILPNGTRTALSFAFTGASSGVIAADHIPGFHTLARVGGQIISLGGLQGACDCGGPNQFPYRNELLGTQAGSPGMFSLEVVGNALQAEEVAGTFVPSMFHGATHLLRQGASALEEDLTRFVVSGGAAVNLEPLSQVVLVTESGGTLSARGLGGGAQLIQPRWGHELVPVDEHQLLVLGGIVKESGTYRTISGAEVLLYGLGSDELVTIPGPVCQGNSLLSPDSGL